MTDGTLATGSTICSPPARAIGRRRLHVMRRVLYAPVSRDPEALSRCASVLSDAEQRRADRFVTEDGKAHFKQQRAFRRYCGAFALGSARPLSRIVSRRRRKGVPTFPNCRMSGSAFPPAGSVISGRGLRHSGSVSTSKIRQGTWRRPNSRKGIFQKPRQRPLKRQAMTRLRTFFQLWTLKEAALKSIGEGLPFGLDAFQFELAPNLRVVHAPRDYGGPERFNAHVIEGTDSCAALVIRSVA